MDHSHLNSYRAYPACISVYTSCIPSVFLCVDVNCIVGCLWQYPLSGPGILLQYTQIHVYLFDYNLFEWWYTLCWTIFLLHKNGKLSTVETHYYPQPAAMSSLSVREEVSISWTWTHIDRIGENLNHSAHMKKSLRRIPLKWKLALI